MDTNSCTSLKNNYDTLVLPLFIFIVIGFGLVSSAMEGVQTARLVSPDQFYIYGRQQKKEVRKPLNFPNIINSITFTF